MKPIKSLCAALPLAWALSLPSFAQSYGPAEAPPSPKATVIEALRAPAGATPATHIDLGLADQSSIDVLKKANAVPGLKMLRIGIGRDVVGPEGSSASLLWTPVAGGYVAHWEVTSTGARALRVALSARAIDPLAQLRFIGSDAPQTVYGPVSGTEIAANHAFWSPVLEGERATVEVFVPSPANLQLAIPQVSHLFVSPLDRDVERLAKVAEACEVDFICRATSDAQLAQAGRAVARMTITEEGSSGFCTGTLLNPADNSFTPYFLSAAHCISTQEAARSLSTYWFYERSACGAGTVSTSAVQVGGGATLLHANVSNDFSLMRLNSSPPSGAVYAGWDAAFPTLGAAVTAVHHPAGDVKKVSAGTLSSLGPASQNLATGNFQRVSWNSTATGVTEGGSSGSALFTGNSSAGYRARGGLLGGPSSCTATAANLFDEYSRLDLAFGYIAQYLAPGTQPALTDQTVANPGFEGTASWSQTSSSGLAIITSDAAVAHSGSGYAWLGGANNANDALTQDVFIPGGQARLQFWVRITTAEATTSTAFDTMTVTLTNPATGATVATIVRFTNLGATSGWVQTPIYDLSPYSGQTLRLRFASTTDASDITSFRVDDITLNGTRTASQNNHTALWWNPAESGWGVNVNHQGDIVFATLFTYDTAGAPMWLVMSAGTRQGNSDNFAGDLYRTTGPVFNANPFTPIGAGNVTRVGSMAFSFSGAIAGMAYDVNGVQVTKSMQKQVYGTRPSSCLVTTRSRAASTNYQDLWWVSTESGWGLNITHQDNTLFATLFTYGSNGQGMWLVMSAGVRQADGSYLGDLYLTSGPAFNANPFTPIGAGNLTRVGTMQLRFTGGESGTLTYSVNGASVTKAIARQLFSSPAPSCS
ncbi:MAG: trypsin-like peptidase domain-containing protein [Usitatibacter sp.]